MAYTLEQLKEINPLYDHEHTLRDSDVSKANEWISIIESTRDENKPKTGDVVIFTNEYGDYYPKALVDEVEEDGQLHICEQPSSPFLHRKDDDTISLSTSGGAWTRIPSGELKLVGKTHKAFSDWGWSGPRGNGAINFFAEVNLWEYSRNELPYSTKTHDRFNVTIREEPKTDEYKYLIRKGATPHTAFDTTEEYEAWLNTFHGVQQEDREDFIWTYKQKKLYVPLEEYRKLNGVVDSELCNGRVQECKRVYEDTTVTTYLPHQNDRIELKDTTRYQRAYNK